MRDRKPHPDPPPSPTPAKGRRRHRARWLSQTEIPITVYAAIFATMAVLWVYQEVNPDVTLGMFTELAGAAFTLFIIDTLLVRSKTKRWKRVQEHVEYLIARNINRLRDGLAVRAFGFDPAITPDRTEQEQLAEVRTQRASLLSAMEDKGPEGLLPHLAEDRLFGDEAYQYLNDKADDLWDILNMKYSEYMAPGLVSDLMQLHTHMKDLGAHIRQYGKAHAFPEDAAYYHRVGRLTASYSVWEILTIVNELKQQGYSEAARMGAPAAAA